MRVFQAEIALLLVSAACMGCSYSRVTDDWTPIQLGLVRSAQLFPSMYDVHGVRINVLNGRSPIVTGLDLGLGLNESDASHGLQGGFWNCVETEGWGLQAGVANFVGQGHVDDGYSGLQVAGFSNSGSADGIQIAGYVNGGWVVKWGEPWIPGNIRGLQIAGAFNKAESVAGVQVAAGNLSWNGFSGLQVGGINFAFSPEPSRPERYTPRIHAGDAPKPVRGLQVAGVANVASSVAGVQVAALFNRSEGGFSGLQVGGVNAAVGETKIGADGRGMCSGVQLGVGNATYNADFCVQVGVINVVDGGSGVQFGLWNSNPDGFLPYFPILNFSF